MEEKEIIEGLKDLVIDRESLITDDTENDDIFVRDKKVLLSAIEYIEKRSKQTVSIDYEKECAKLNNRISNAEEEYKQNLQANSEFYGQTINQKDNEIAWYKKVIEGDLHI